MPVEVGIHRGPDRGGGIRAGREIQVDHAQIVHQGTHFERFCPALELDLELPDADLIRLEAIDLLADPVRLAAAKTTRKQVRDLVQDR